jgi:hypothetical protein
MWVSENLLEELRSRLDFKERITVAGQPQDIMFDVLGNITP